ncbi:MAG: hypothetical protein Kapaf2KO_20490 [Candidatus Kapaibacteriales bacterium]
MIFCLLGLSETNSQDVKELEKPNLKFGIYAGLNYNMHLAEFDSLPDFTDCCSEYGNTSGFGPRLGVLAGIPIAPKSRIMLRLGYSTLDGEFKEVEEIGNTIDVTSPATAEFTLDAALQAIDLSAEYEYNIWDNLNLYGGLRGGYIFSATAAQYETLLQPTNASFIDPQTGNLTNTRGEPFTYNEINDISSIQFWVGGGVGYFIPVGNVFLEPYLRYYHPITDLASVDWQVATLNFGIDAYIELEPAKDVIKDKIFLRDTTVLAEVGGTGSIVLAETSEEVSEREDEENIYQTTTIREKYIKTMPLDYTFTGELAGDFRDYSKIVIEETETREAFPLLPYVFFDDGSSALSSTSQNQITPSEAASFDELDQEWDVLKIHTNLLNIVGKRLTENPNATITLTGTNSTKDADKSADAVSQKRAKSVADYLIKVWGIDGNRIGFKSRDLPEKPGRSDIKQGVEENRRVEISSDDVAITSYLNLSRIEKTSNPPVLNIGANAYHTLDDTGYDYSLNISQDGNLLRSQDYSGQDTTSNRYRWTIADEPMPKLEEPIDIELTGRDQYGATFSENESIELEQLTIRKKREILKNDQVVEKYSLIVFDYDSAELTKAQKSNLKTVYSAINPSSTVEVDGHTDNIGSDEYNLELSKRRIDEVIRTLGLEEGKNVSKIIRNPQGAKNPPYTNSSAKGRSYNRTVIITIYRPVGSN